MAIPTMPFSGGDDGGFAEVAVAGSNPARPLRVAPDLVESVALSNVSQATSRAGIKFG
jgi:hypothetical protein